MTQSDLIVVILAVLGFIGGLIAYIFHTKIEQLQKAETRIADDLDRNVGKLERSVEASQQSQGERIGELERRVAVEYATRQELKEVTDTLGGEIGNVRRLIEKLFDKLDDMKESYVSAKNCKSFHKDD